MAKSAGEILTSQRILKLISRQKRAINPIARFLGMNIGGANRIGVGGRKTSYDIFNNTRRIASPRAPGVANARREPQVVGNVDVIFPRAAETIPLLDETLLNFRNLGGPAEGQLSASAERYITKQEMYLGQRFENIIEFQAAAMLRGQYVFTVQNDDLFHDFTGTGHTIDFKIPAGNKDGLNMLGGGNLITGPWATDSTDILKQLHAISAAMQQLYGVGLSHILCNSDVWTDVLRNDSMQEVAGSANRVFEKQEVDENRQFTARLHAAPWVEWHIMDHVLETGSSNTTTKMLADDHASFLPEPSTDWVEYMDGSEIVTEGPGGVRAERAGFYPNAYATHDPSGWDLCAVQNGLPALYVPNAIAYGDVSTAAA